MVADDTQHIGVGGAIFGNAEVMHMAAHHFNHAFSNALSRLYAYNRTAHNCGYRGSDGGITGRYFLAQVFVGYNANRIAVFYHQYAANTAVCHGLGCLLHGSIFSTGEHLFFAFNGYGFA